MKNQDEYGVVVRVRDKEADEYEYGDGLWFWNDEDMALRLAKYLKPAPDPYAATYQLERLRLRRVPDVAFGGGRRPVPRARGCR